MRNNNNIKTLNEYEIASEIIKGNKIILSKTITYLESTRVEHNIIADKVLELVQNNTGNSIRIGITGIPGVGKSTFIESLVKYILQFNKKVAVLAIDPTSNKTKGSILGDKTRMQEISNNEDVFIRPSPAGNELGGVSKKTRETILLCEACGFDTIFVETVGVGQSEITVEYMVDVFLLLMLSSAGDELQGIKKGIMEMADIIVINKAVNKNDIKANKAIANYKNALHYMQEKESKWITKVTSCSALNNYNIDNVWDNIIQYSKHTKKNNFWYFNRNTQSIYWIKKIINEKLLKEFYENFHVKQALQSVEKSVLEGKLDSYKAAEIVLKSEKTK